AADKAQAQQLKPIAWTDGVSRIHLPAWRGTAASIAPHLAGCTLAGLPSDKSFREALGRNALGERAAEIDADGRVVSGAGSIATVVTLGLVELGVTLDAAPGEHVTLTRGVHAIHPYDILLDAARAERCIEDLRAACAAAGVMDLDLAAVAQRAT